MKIKHNKKRNTAFIYEALIREATVAAMRGDAEKRKTVIGTIKKHFNSNSLLKKDLGCYQSLYKSHGLPQDMAQKIVTEARIASRLIDPDRLFKQQTGLINDINKTISPSVFDNFVPNYKTLASIAQIFSHKQTPRNSVILENQIIQYMTEPLLEPRPAPDDKLVYEVFVDKFNKKYENELLQEQKQLLSCYISSFADNALELKVFLNEEIYRLKEKLQEAKTRDEIKNDSEMFEKTDKLIERLSSFSTKPINEKIVATVIKTQQLVKEIYENGNSN